MAERQARTDARYEEMAERQKNDRVIIERLDNSLEKHDKILANLEANQIVIGKAMEGIRTEVGRMVKILNEFMDVVGYKFREHENRIMKLEEN